MIELLTLSVATGALTATLTLSQPYQWLLNILNINIKPFNCPICLAFWSFIFAGLILQSPVVALFSGIAAFTANLIEKEYYNL